MTSNQEILKKIKERTELNENNCLIWKGIINKHNLCILNHGPKVYYVHNFIWDINNQENKLNRKTHKCIRTCNNFKCVNHEHLKIIPIVKELTKQDYWNIIIKKGEKQENGCLFWMGTCGQAGYGYISIKNKTYTVHRLSYWIHNDNQIIPKDDENGSRLLIRHLCNNSKCFEPTHLKLGTQFENDYDDKLLNNTLKRGISHYNSSITEEKAKEIKLSKKEKTDSDYETQKNRAKKFGVSLHVVKSIDSCKSWAFIPDANGNISSSRKIKARGHRKNAKNKVWSQDMFDEAKKRLLDKSKLSSEINKPFVDTYCRLWVGNVSKCGYGYINIYGKKI